MNHTSQTTQYPTNVLIAVPDGEGEAGRAPDEHEEQTKWVSSVTSPHCLFIAGVDAEERELTADALVLC